MAEKGFWPLYEGKHIEQFLVDIRPIQRWVSLEACQKKYGRHVLPLPKLHRQGQGRSTSTGAATGATPLRRSPIRGSKAVESHLFIVEQMCTSGSHYLHGDCPRAVNPGSWLEIHEDDPGQVGGPGA
jgi:hypothetical protein